MPKDILLDENDDLLFANGDFVIGESTHQHQKHLLLAQKGEYRASPASGVGIGNYINDDELQDLGAEIQIQFEADGMTVKTLNIFEEGKVDVNAAYDD